MSSTSMGSSDLDELIAKNSLLSSPIVSKGALAPPKPGSSSSFERDYKGERLERAFGKMPRAPVLAESSAPDITLSSPADSVSASSGSPKLEDHVPFGQLHEVTQAPAVVVASQLNQDGGLASSSDSGQEDRLPTHVQERGKSDLADEIAGLKQRTSAEIKALKTQAGNLAQQLRHSEHRVKAKDTEIERLTLKLQDEVDKEKAMRDREKTAFDCIRGDNKMKGMTERKVREVLGTYERAKGSMEEEISSLRAENKQMAEGLREKENYIMSREAGIGWDILNEDGLYEARLRLIALTGPPTQNDENSWLTAYLNWPNLTWPDLTHQDGTGGVTMTGMSTRLLDAQQELARANRKVAVMLHKEKKLRAQLNQSEVARKHVCSKAEQLEDMVENLRLECNSRPCRKEWLAVQYRCEELQLKLIKARSQVKEAYNLKQLRRFTDTRELIARDRRNAKLRIDTEVIENLPASVMKETLKDACRELSVNDIADICPGIQKLTKVVKAVPRLASFAEGALKAVRDHEGARGTISSGFGLEEALVAIKQLLREKEAAGSQAASND
ncbi:unnamed protein product [Chrysoparadoxa australica]